MKLSMTVLSTAGLIATMSVFTNVAVAQTSTTTPPNTYDADTRDNQRGFDLGWLGLLGLAGLAGLARKKEDHLPSSRTGMGSTAKI